MRKHAAISYHGRRLNHKGVTLKLRAALVNRTRSYWKNMVATSKHCGEIRNKKPNVFAGHKSFFQNRQKFEKLQTFLTSWQLEYLVESSISSDLSWSYAIEQLSWFYWKDQLRSELMELSTRYSSCQKVRNIWSFSSFCRFWKKDLWPI